MNDLKTISGTALGRVAYGTMQWGGGADASAAQAMFEQARAAGIVHYDTAHLYNGGAAEELLGRFVDDRDAVYVATKVGYTGGAGRDNILSAFDISRRRLQMDQVDLLYMHRFDPDMPLEETFETLADLQVRGLIRHIGVSNYAAWQVMKAQSVARQMGTRIDVIQPMYSLVKRQAEVEILPMCADQGIFPCTYSPLGGGLLSGKYATVGAAGRLAEDDRYAARYGDHWMHVTADGLARLGAELGVAPATLAVAWILRASDIAAPILSGRTAQQMEASLAALDFPMADDLFDRISALSRRPAPATDRLDEQ